MLRIMHGRLLSCVHTKHAIDSHHPGPAAADSEASSCNFDSVKIITSPVLSAQRAPPVRISTPAVAHKDLRRHSPHTVVHHLFTGRWMDGYTPMLQPTCPSSKREMSIKPLSGSPCAMHVCSAVDYQEGGGQFEDKTTGDGGLRRGHVAGRWKRGQEEGRLSQSGPHVYWDVGATGILQSGDIELAQPHHDLSRHRFYQCHTSVMWMTLRSSMPSCMCGQEN